jgi:hypothetical protein
MSIWPLMTASTILLVLMFCHDEIWPVRESFVNETCIKATSNNPFMNPTLFEEPLPPCDEQPLEPLRYKDVDDLFDRNHQERFFTVPRASQPHDIREFAQFLYPIGKTCKENNLCLIPDNLKSKTI